MNINCNSIRRYPFVSILLATTMLSTSVDADNKLYKWVDKNGKVSYQSSPPPANSKILKESTLKTNNAGGDQSNNPPVVVYTVVNCPACIQVMDRLKKMSVPFSEKSLADQQVQNNVLNATGQLAAPTVSIGGRFLSDTSTEALNQQLGDAGYNVGDKEPKPRTNRLGAVPETEDPSDI